MSACKTDIFCLSCFLGFLLVLKSGPFPGSESGWAICADQVFPGSEGESPFCTFIWELQPPQGPFQGILAEEKGFGRTLCGGPCRALRFPI